MDKHLVARRVVQLVQQQNPPCRFLAKDGNVYIQAPFDKVLDKICQALRDVK